MEPTGLFGFEGGLIEDSVGVVVVVEISAELISIVGMLVDDSTSVVSELESPVSENTMGGEYGVLTTIAAWEKALAPLSTTLMLNFSLHGLTSESCGKILDYNRTGQRSEDTHNVKFNRHTRSGGGRNIRIAGFDTLGNVGRRDGI